MAKAKRQKPVQPATTPAMVAGVALAVGAAAVGLWRWSSERRVGATLQPDETDDTRVEQVVPTPHADARPIGEPMIYTGGRSPDMAVNYIPGEDATSLDNEDTRTAENIIPPPLYELS